MTDQPAPKPGRGDVWLEVIGDPIVLWMPAELDRMCWKRRDLGIARYETPIQYDNGRDTRRDAREEGLDLAVYLWALGWRWTARAVLVLAWGLR